MLRRRCLIDEAPLLRLRLAIAATIRPPAPRTGPRALSKKGPGFSPGAFSLHAAKQFSGGHDIGPKQTGPSLPRSSGGFVCPVTSPLDYSGPRRAPCVGAFSFTCEEGPAASRRRSAIAVKVLDIRHSSSPCLSVGKEGPGQAPGPFYLQRQRARRSRSSGSTRPMHGVRLSVPFSRSRPASCALSTFATAKPSRRARC